MSQQETFQSTVRHSAARLVCVPLRVAISSGAPGEGGVLVRICRAWVCQRHQCFLQLLYLFFFVSEGSPISTDMSNWCITRSRILLTRNIRHIGMLKPRFHVHRYIMEKITITGYKSTTATDLEALLQRAISIHRGNRVSHPPTNNDFKVFSRVTLCRKTRRQ